MFNLEKILSKIIKYGLYAVLLMPLAFWPDALYGFLVPKFILFQVLIEIVFGAWLILALSNPEYRPKKSNLLLALLIFTAASIISATFGVDFSRSIWGIGARMTGLFAELHFLAWFLVLISVPKPGLDIEKYLNFSFAVCVIVAFSAFFQNLNWRIVFGYTIFSNPTFVAPYFLFHFFWGLYKSIGFGNLLKRSLFLIGTALITVALVMGQIRGAIVGFLAGIFVVGIFLIFSDIIVKKNYRMFIAALMLVVILSVSSIFIFKNSEFIKNSTYLSRFSSISLNTITAQTRILTWQSAMKGFFAAPIFGAGPENFNYLFNANYNPQLLMYGGSSFAETWQDKPHNIYLEILTEQGIIGALIYISIWILAAFYLLRIFKNEQKLLAVSLLGAFAFYLTSMFFSFDSFGSWFGLFLFLAALTASSNANQERFFSSVVVGRSTEKIFKTTTVLVVMYLILLNYPIWRANLADANALRIFSKNPEIGLVLFEKSLSYKSPYKSEYQFDFIASVAGAVEKGAKINNLENVINLAIDEAEKAISAHPKTASSYTDMARIYNIFGTLGRDPEILAKAQQFGEKSLELSPNRQETLFYLARTALLQNRPNIAVERAKQAVAADMAIGMSHWYLGLSLIADSQNASGIDEIKKALELGYQFQNQKEKDFVGSLGI